MPIFALTASVAKDELQGCLDAGFTDVVTKPLQRQRCRAILAQHGHTLPPEKETPRNSISESKPGAAAAAAAAVGPAAGGGVTGGGAANGGVTGGGAASGGVTGGAAASGGVTGGAATSGGMTGGAAAAPRGLQLQHAVMRGRHILYAEDSIASQTIVKRMLVHAGVKCTVVDNGEAAVHAALSACPPFDCILMVGPAGICRHYFRHIDKSRIPAF